MYYRSKQCWLDDRELVDKIELMFDSSCDVNPRKNMLKNLVRLEHKVGERLIHLLCDNNCPLVDLKDALCRFTKFVCDAEDQAKAQQDLEKQKVEESKPEETKVEELSQPSEVVA